MCPVCSEPLVVFELDGVELDRCLKCAGTWLDAGEIDHLARLQGDPPDPISSAIAQAEGGARGKRKCVRCSVRMWVVTVHGVELDRCPRGHGVWFDKDEMESLIATFRDANAGAVARFLGEFHPAKKKGG